MKVTKLKEKINKETIIRIVLFAFLSCCYLILLFNSNGNLILKDNADAEFHFSRILSLSNVWKSPVNFHYYGHTGEIVNLMYPWFTVYPMYILIKLTGSIIAGYYIYFFVITFATLEITYKCMRDIGQKKYPSIFVSVLYTFAICRTSDIYCRCDVGEAVSLTIFPIVLLGIYRLLYLRDPHWKTLVVGMTLLVYTHILSLVIASVMILFFVIIRTVHCKFKLSHFISLLKAGLMSVLLGIGFLVPMIQVLFTVQLNGPQEFDLYDAALKPSDFIQWSLQNQASTRDLYSVAFLIVIVVIILNLRVFKGFYKDVLIGFTFFTFICTTLFPWGLFQNQFKMLQFPWRFITVSSLLLCVAAGELFQKFEYDHTNTVSKNLLLITIAMLVVSHWGTMNDVYKWDGNKVGKDSEWYAYDIKRSTSFNGAGDYNPKVSGNDAGCIASQQMCVDGQWVNVHHKVISSESMIYKYYSDGDSTAILPVYVYPGEKVTLNGNRINTQAADADGATLVNLVNGINKVKISYGYTLLARISWIISIISYLIFNGLVLHRKRKINVC